MTPLDYCSALIVVGWFVLTCIAQVRTTGGQRIRRFDVFGLLPGWNFFAPEPITQDFELRGRTWTDAQNPGSWMLLPVVDARRPWHVLFNSNRRAKKAFFVLCVDLVRAARSRRSAMAAVSYLTLLDYVTGALGAAWGVQFEVSLVSHTASGPKRTPMVTSAVHRVSSGVR